MEFVVKDPFGIHARVATKIVNLVERYNADIKLICGDREVGGDSMLLMMHMGVKKGETVKIVYRKVPERRVEFEGELRKILEG